MQYFILKVVLLVEHIHWSVVAGRLRIFQFATFRTIQPTAETDYGSSGQITSLEMFMQILYMVMVLT